MNNKHKSGSFMQGIFILIFSQALIKVLGLIHTLYLTNKNGFGDIGNAIYSSGYQIYSLLLTISSIGVPNAISKLVSERVAIRKSSWSKQNIQSRFYRICICWTTRNSTPF